MVWIRFGIIAPKSFQKKGRLNRFLFKIEPPKQNFRVPAKKKTKPRSEADKVDQNESKPRMQRFKHNRIRFPTEFKIRRPRKKSERVSLSLQVQGESRVLLISTLAGRGGAEAADFWVLLICSLTARPRRGGSCKGHISRCCQGNLSFTTRASWTSLWPAWAGLCKSKDREFQLVNVKYPTKHGVSKLRHFWQDSRIGRVNPTFRKSRCRSRSAFFIFLVFAARLKAAEPRLSHSSMALRAKRLHRLPGASVRH